MPRLCPGCGCGGRGWLWPCGGDGLGGPGVVFLGPGGKMKHVARQRLCLVLGSPAAWRWKGRGGSGTWCPSRVPPHVPSWHRWARGELVFPNGEKPKEAEKKGSGSMVFPFCVHWCAPACSQVQSSSLREGTGGGSILSSNPPPEPQAGCTGRKLEPVVLPPPCAECLHNKCHSSLLSWGHGGGREPPARPGLGS